MLSDQLTSAISFVILAGAILIIIKSVGHTILERRKEFGIMKAVGFTSRDIQKEVVTETFVQVLIGFVIGIVLSFVAITLLARIQITIIIPWELNPIPHFLVANPALTSTVQNYMLPITFQVIYALLSLAVVSAIGIITSLVLMRQINRLRAMEVLRYE